MKRDNKPLKWDCHHKQQIVECIIDVAKRHRAIKDGVIDRKVFNNQVRKDVARAYTLRSPLQSSLRGLPRQQTSKRLPAVMQQIHWLLDDQRDAVLAKTHLPGLKLRT